MDPDSNSEAEKIDGDRVKESDSSLMIHVFVLDAYMTMMVSHILYSA